jgi:dynein heavy chain 2
MAIGADSLFNIAHKKVLNNLDTAEEEILNLLR